jgi:predicted phosphoadenosine phosphosulfate sulfurtransferase
MPKNPELVNVYPLYDWGTKDIWVYHGKHRDKAYNKIYDLMGQAGLSIHQARLCQFFGDDQRKGLWLLHILEPLTWARTVARVNGANSGAAMVQETGNMSGYRKIECPPGHTWQSFSEMLLDSMPPRTQDQYRNHVFKFISWWTPRGYPDGIPDEMPSKQEASREVPSWRRIAKSILKSDYWGKSLSFGPTSSKHFDAYLAFVKAKREAAANIG